MHVKALARTAASQLCGRGAKKRGRRVQATDGEFSCFCFYGHFLRPLAIDRYKFRLDAAAGDSLTRKRLPEYGMFP